MRLIGVFVVASAATAGAFSFAEAAEYGNGAISAFKRALPVLARKDGGGGNCPAVWTKIAGSLKTLFLGSDGQCNDLARAAIRLAFHDCGPWDKSQGSTGGCDGSLVNTIGLTGSTNGIPDRELSRSENGFLTDIAQQLIPIQQQNGVSMADLITFASSVAIVTCPGGPQIQTFVGRKDSSNPAKPGGLPDVHAPAQSLYQLFLDKGFDAKELAALLGAHSTSKAFGQAPEIPPQTPQDATPGLWDVRYYQDTLTPPTGVKPFASDTSLAAHPDVGKEFKGFVNNQGKWTGDFAKAMTHMTLLGVPGGSSNLIDCTSAVPKSTNNKREMRAAPINDRVR